MRSLLEWSSRAHRATGVSGCNPTLFVAFIDPSVPGVFFFGLVVGVCPCNSVPCLGLIGYLTGRETSLLFTESLQAGCSILARHGMAFGYKRLILSELRLNTIVTCRGVHL